jgi:glycosyltransferase involved in cell wall biosynthesis
VTARVLFWSEFFWPYIGGVEIVSAQLLPALCRRGYEFVVVTSHDYLTLPDEAQCAGIPVYRFPFRPALVRGNMAQLVTARRQVAKLKRSFAPDVIHLYGLGPSVFFHLETSKAHTAPLLVTLTNPLPGPVIAQESLQRLLRAATWVTGHAAAIISQARQLVPELTPCSSVIPNWIDIPPFLPDPLPVQAPRLLCLGRLTIQKGFDLALTASCTRHTDRWKSLSRTTAQPMAWRRLRPAMGSESSTCGKPTPGRPRPAIWG